MTNSYKIWKSATHSAKTNVFKILQEVIYGSGSLSNSYKLVKAIVKSQTTFLNDNIFELFKSLTNSNGSNLYEILADCYDETNEAFKVKFVDASDTNPAMVSDTSQATYIITSTTKVIGKMNIVEDSTGYYFRLSNGIPSNIVTNNGVYVTNNGVFVTNS